MAEQRYVCPNCGSENIQRFSVAYQGGAADIDTTTHSAGIGFGGGGIGIGGAKHHTTGVQMTQLAQEVAPPRKRKYWVPLMCAIIAGVIVSIVAGMISDSLSFLGYIAFAAVMYVMGYQKTYLFNKQVPEWYAQWERSWICLKCGHKFTI